MNDADLLPDRREKAELGARMGMWLFLFTEVLLFGGLFLVFAVYFHRFPEDFHEAGKVLNRALGTINTVVLITSSLCVALAVEAQRRGLAARARRHLLETVLLALVFLAIKSVEWGMKISHGLYPGGPEFLSLPPGQMAFFNLYYLMTGLHALHVIIGATLILWTRSLLRPAGEGKNRTVLLENVGLYWHLVDLIWIYLFPLYYLIM